MILDSGLLFGPPCIYKNTTYGLMDYGPTFTLLGGSDQYSFNLNFNAYFPLSFYFYFWTRGPTVTYDIYLLLMFVFKLCFLCKELALMGSCPVLVSGHSIVVVDCF